MRVNLIHLKPFVLKEIGYLLKTNKEKSKDHFLQLTFTLAIKAAIENLTKRVSSAHDQPCSSVVFDLLLLLVVVDTLGSIWKSQN